jgi:hypothetical protein
MCELDPADVLMAEDDPGDALIAAVPSGPPGNAAHFRPSQPGARSGYARRPLLPRLTAASGRSALRSSG